MGVELGTNSEVGALRVAILHRPGAELRRLNPRNSDELLFDGLPWVARAQDEHDQFAELLRARGVEVLLLSELLTEALHHSGAARMQGVAAAVDARRLGTPLAQNVSAYLRGLEPGDAGSCVDGRHDVQRAARRAPAPTCRWCCACTTGRIS